MSSYSTSIDTSSIGMSPMIPLRLTEPENNLTGNTFSKPRRSYTVYLSIDENGRFVARSSDLQGVVTDGATKEETIRNLFEAVEAVIESSKLDKDFILQIFEKPISA